MEAWIDTTDGLDALSRELLAAPWVGLDTEADSLYAYPEKLCLVQVSIPGLDALIDPLAGLELAPLQQAFLAHRLILHGGDYDLRLLYRTRRFVPRAVFDTMLAARLLGSREFGLERLVARILGVKLEKGPQRANWARRPLTPRMMAYARADSHYLKPLADHLSKELERHGRLDWHAEMCRRLIVDCTRESEIDPDTVWRLSGAHRLDRRGLAVLRELWHWRDQEARRLSRPPFFVLPHDTLVKLAENATRQAANQAVLRGLPSASIRARLAELIEEALALPDSRLPPVRRSTGVRLSLEQRRYQERLESRRNRVAHDLGLEPSLVASRSMLVGLAGGKLDPERDLMSWQRRLLLDANP